MLIRIPEAWPRPLVAVLAMLALAALDLAGAYAAKESVERRSAGYACFGLVCFCLAAQAWLLLAPHASPEG